MKTPVLLLALALATVACAASVKEVNEDTKAIVPEHDDGTLKEADKKPDTPGGIGLEGKVALNDARKELADIIEAVQLLENSKNAIDEETSQYFFRKIKRALENVAKAVVISKVTGAVIGAIG
ncbi:uncharacterized protein LOC144167515 isoform X2 [Haemaphysalis longicornis]